MEITTRNSLFSGSSVASAVVGSMLNTITNARSHVSMRFFMCFPPVSFFAAILYFLTPFPAL